MKLILDIATILGGVAAIWFLLQQLSSTRSRRRAERAFVDGRPLQPQIGSYRHGSQSSKGTNAPATETAIRRRIQPALSATIAAISGGVGSFVWGFVLFSFGEVGAFIAMFAIPVFLLSISELSKSAGYEDASEAVAIGIGYFAAVPASLQRER